MNFIQLKASTKIVKMIEKVNFIYPKKQLYFILKILSPRIMRH